MTEWKPSIDAITLFTEDLAAARAFYATVFGLEPVHEDEVSTAYPFSGTIINLLSVGAAPELVERPPWRPRPTGPGWC